MTATVAAAGALGSTQLSRALLWVLPLVLFAALLTTAYGWWRRLRAASEIREWALIRGFSTWSTRADLATRYEHGPFGRCRGRVALGVVEGEYGGVPVRLFTYECATGSGRDRQVVHHRVAAAALDLWVPLVELGAESILTRAWGAVRGDDLDLESHEFNQAYRIRAKDRRVAVALLHPAAIEYLLTHRRSSWWFEQGEILFADKGEWRAADLDQAVADVVGMARLVPTHLRREFGADPVGGAR